MPDKKQSQADLLKMAVAQQETTSAPESKKEAINEENKQEDQEWEEAKKKKQEKPAPVKVNPVQQHKQYFRPAEVARAAPAYNP